MVVNPDRVSLEARFPVTAVEGVRVPVYFAHVSKYNLTTFPHLFHIAPTI